MSERSQNMLRRRRWRVSIRVIICVGSYSLCLKQFEKENVIQVSDTQVIQKQITTNVINKLL